MSPYNIVAENLAIVVVNVRQSLAYSARIADYTGRQLASY